MNNETMQALSQDRIIDITTIGRKTKRLRRKEIWFHNVEGRIFITGLPGRRSWYANLRANPDFTFHPKQSIHADLPARATPITDEPRRREILPKILQKLGRPRDLEAWIKGSPLVEVTFREF